MGLPQDWKYSDLSRYDDFVPLVISKSGSVQYVVSEEALAEILGHSNFDGENWAIGDRIIFEDGTESSIKQEPGEQFFNWDDSKPADFEEVKRVVGVPNAPDWKQLFAGFEERSTKSGCFTSTSVIVAFVITALTAV